MPTTFGSPASLFEVLRRNSPPSTRVILSRFPFAKEMQLQAAIDKPLFESIVPALGSETLEDERLHTNLAAYQDAWKLLTSSHEDTALRAAETVMLKEQAIFGVSNPVERFKILLPPTDALMCSPSWTRTGSRSRSLDPATRPSSAGSSRTQGPSSTASGPATRSTPS